LLPRGFIVSFSQVYIDESGSHDGSPALSVAGYIFERDSAAKFSGEWKTLLQEYGLPFFRMTDCAHGTGPFSGLTEQQRIDVETRGIEIIKR
jgi:hypothetical protein